MEDSRFRFASSPLPSSSSELYISLAPHLQTTQGFVVLLLVLVSTVLAYFTHKDYQTFLSLGRGGTPYNFYGYMKITSLRLFTLSDPFAPAPVPEELRDTGFLRSGLPKRSSDRPYVIGIAPHRQMNQRPQREVTDSLYAAIGKLAQSKPEDLYVAISAFEKHCPALFTRRHVNQTKQGEVCHAHKLDGSMHMTLHPEDIKAVLESGWGERHPLAAGGWCTRFVPHGFVMIYAPRNQEEIEIVMDIIKAGIGWVSGEAHIDRDASQQIKDHPMQSEDCTDVTCSLI